MEEGRAARTAILSAVMRVAHLQLDGEPEIFSDPFALGLSGFESEAPLTESVSKFLATLTADAGAECAQATFNYLRAGMTVRSRYTEDELTHAIRRGTAQYVILGAGLDSFAYRRRDLASLVRVFEVELPTSQHWKRERLRALKMSEPEGLVFVPLDLERQVLLDGLCAAGCRVEMPAFVSWLGTTQYLTTEAVFKTLKETASRAKRGPLGELVRTGHAGRAAHSVGIHGCRRFWAGASPDSLLRRPYGRFGRSTSESPDEGTSRRRLGAAMMLELRG